jgi:hypothetical protein
MRTSARYISLAVLLLVFAQLAAAQKGVTYFNKPIKIPFALANGSKTVPPGEYTVKIQDEGGQPTLSYISKDGSPLIKKTGDRDLVPEKEQTFGRGGHFKVTTATDPKTSGRLIVFLYDFVDPKGGQYVRYRFSIPEAAAEATK